MKQDEHWVGVDRLNGALRLLLLLLLLTFPATAAAISAPIHIANTGGEGVFIRPEPNTSHPAIGWMPEGASPDYHCFVWGQNINGVPIWFYVTYNGVTGYYASYYDDSSYHSNEELTAKYGVPLCGSTPAPQPAPAPPATPSGSGIYSIVNAEDGIFYRNSPSWGDTSRIPGVGVYNGDRVELLCGSYGDPVGPYSNKAWSKVRNLTRPAIGEGWVNEHFINDGAPTNGFVSGEPMCQTFAPPSSSGPKSVFYSPNDIPTGVNGLNVVADLNLVKDEWVAGNCSTRAATNIPVGVSTLAGWSLGRLGPIYVLAGDFGRWPEIHRIILFDPGSAANMSDCDKSLNPAVGDLLAQWITSDSHNHLEVYTGKDTEEPTVETGKPNFSGLWHYYFPRLWNQPFAATQVRVCDYPFVGHERILTALAWVVEHPVSRCPGVSGLPLPIEWHP